METLQLLGVALGLAGLAGINLYLTVFVAGLAIRTGWIALLPQYGQLEILGHPVIIGIAGFLYFVEFFADKIPWVDTAWDTIHTAIRPIGGAMLAVRVLGTPDPVFDVVIVLLGGSVSMLTHSVKAGTRLLVNASPEPFSNIALSVGEDVVVLAGLGLIYANPVVALIVMGTVVATVIFMAPRLWRATKVRLWLTWWKLNNPANGGEAPVLTRMMPADFDILFSHLNLLGGAVEWAVPCVSGRAKRIDGNLFGYLIATAEEPQKLHFVAKKGWSKIAETLDLADYKVALEPKFLSNNLVLYSTAAPKKPKYTFVFDRSRTALAKLVEESLRERLQTPTHSAAPPSELRQAPEHQEAAAV